MKTIILKFDLANKNIFDDIKSGRKKIETRAGGKYPDIENGDTILFQCGDESCEKEVKKVSRFVSIADMLERMNPSDVVSSANSAEDLKNIYHSFPGYEERISKFGLISFEF